MIGRQCDDRAFNYLELARFNSQQIQKHRTDNDPANRKETEARSVSRRRDRRLPRHPVNADRHGKCCDEA